MASSSASDCAEVEIETTPLRLATQGMTSNLVKVADFKSAVSNIRLETLEDDSVNTVLAQEMGMTTDSLLEIRQMCDLPSATIPSTISISNSPLACVRDNKHAITFLDKKDHNSISYINVINVKPDKDDGDSLACSSVSKKEVLLGVDVFHPTRQVKSQHTLVLGCQKLTELRDKILCPNDFVHDEDLSEDPSVLEEETISEDPVSRSKSAFFFINNIFYDDMRDPQSVKTSSKIIEWLEERKNISQQHYSATMMENVSFEDLELVLGHPYLYSHHGNCEHLIIFRDLRLFNSRHDAPYIENYPRLLYYTKIKRRPCHACAEDATWITCDDELAPESPCFFCHSCFVKLHYSTDNEKMCQFKAYRYQVPNPPLLPYY